MVVLDTNVVSELIRLTPAPAVLDWASRLPRNTLFTTAITEAELRFGVAMLTEGRRKRELADAVEIVFADLLSDRVLPFDRAAAAEYAIFLAERRRAGRPTSTADVQIAAIARAHGAALLATRNIRDFEGCGVALVDPWREGG